MFRLSKREQKLIIFTLLFAVLAMFFVYYYFPLVDEIEELTEKKLEISETLNTNQQMKLLTDALEKEYELLEKERLESTENFINGYDEAELLNYINTVIGDKTERTVVSFSDINQEDIYLYGDINMNIKTNYKELTDMISELEEGKYFSSIQSIDISTLSDNEAEVDGTTEPDAYPLQVNVILRFYAKNQMIDITDSEQFNSGSYGKSNIFQ